MLRPVSTSCRSWPRRTSWLSSLGRCSSRGFQQRSGYSTQRTSDPLRILFCGSDAFSCASLKALHDEHLANPSLIQSLDVVLRPGKPTGRGLKTIRHPPIKDLATNLGLPIHERDTFTGWNMPPATNLIVAVSFGLFVPPRLLGQAKYGGLNLHPSLLPDLRGPAPLHHTLIEERKYTGVTLQTLDEKTFDHGVVLAQTPRDSMAVPRDCTLEQLHDLITPPAAEMLIQGLRDGLYVPPTQDCGWKPTPAEQASLRHAPKIRKSDRIFLWDQESGGRALRRQEVIGPLWFQATDERGQTKRVIVEDLVDAAVEAGELDPQTGLPPGCEARLLYIEHQDSESHPQALRAYIKPDDEAVLYIAQPDQGGGGRRRTLALRKVKVEGERTQGAKKALQGFLRDA